MSIRQKHEIILAYLNTLSCAPAACRTQKAFIQELGTDMLRAQCRNCWRLSEQLVAVVQTVVTSNGTVDPTRNVLTTCSTCE